MKPAVSYRPTRMNYSWSITRARVRIVRFVKLNTIHISICSDTYLLCTYVYNSSTNKGKLTNKLLVSLYTARVTNVSFFCNSYYLPTSAFTIWQIIKLFKFGILRFELYTLFNMKNLRIHPKFKLRKLVQTKIRFKKSYVVKKLVISTSLRH